MSDRFQSIRDALAMGPTPGPWDGDDNSVSRLWSNGTAGIREYIALPDGAEGSAPNPADMHFIAACDPDTIRELLAERDQLAAALEAARADAARYRWLRDPCSGAERVIFYCRGDYGRGLMSSAMLDAAIDQARGKAGQEVGK